MESDIKKNLLEGLDKATEIRAEEFCGQVGIDHEEMTLWMRTHPKDQVQAVLESLDVAE